MAAETSRNSLISTKPSDSGLHVALHPLVLLTISDHITRHAARQQQGPIVGALLGQQQGREISLEHAFECHTTSGPHNEVLLHHDWFSERVQQFKDVHKAPTLDLVGWFTITPRSGPEAPQLTIHRQILQEYNENAVLLAFHPSQLHSDSAASGAKLPLTVYESIFEGDNAGDGDKVMQLDGEEQGLPIRFRELPYSVETGEAEMISVDFVARGGGNAMAVEAPVATKAESAAGKKKRPGKKDDEKTKEDGQAILSPEDEDLIANLTTRLNAVKTLESRIRLLKSYLQSLPASFLDSSDSAGTVKASEAANSTLSHPILRSISSLISDLSLLTPQDSRSFAIESLAQENDVALVSLLGQLGENVQLMRELGKKLAIVEASKQSGMSSTSGRKSQFTLQSRFEEHEIRDPGAMQL